MKISEIRIENLRGYVDQTIPINDYTCLVGSNGAGKSTILCALCIFFRDTEHFANNLQFLQGEDFHRLDTAKPIRITVTFTELSPAAQVDFRDYYRQGKLIVTASAEFNTESKTADVKQYGQRLVMKDFRSFFAADAESKPVAILKEKYEDIRKKYPSLPEPGTKAKMTEALRDYESEHANQCVLVPSSDQFYGFSNGSNRLAKYVQWVYVPAVKDATTEQTESKATALGKLLARTVRSRVDFSEKLTEMRVEFTEKYNQLLAEKQASLQELSAILGERLKDWAHPDTRVKLEWKLPPDLPDPESRRGGAARSQPAPAAAPGRAGCTVHDPLAGHHAPGASGAGGQGCDRSRRTTGSRGSQRERD